MDDINLSMSELYEVIVESILSSSLSGLAGLAAYILLAVGLYSIADRRGISKPWLAWIPFGQVWILGSISDQFQYVTMGRQKSKRKTLLALEILMTVLGIAICVMIISVIVEYLIALPMDGTLTADMIDQKVMDIFVPMMAVVLMSLLLLGMSIAYVVVYYMALYDLYRSCEPANATLFTVLSIFLSGLLQGLFVLVSRKKDLGMPPRRDQVIFQPGYLSEQSVAEPWQQNQKPQDPWDP